MIKGRDPLAEGLEFGSIGVVGPGFVDEIGDLCNIGFLHPTGGDFFKEQAFCHVKSVGVSGLQELEKKCNQNTKKTQP